MNPANAGFCGQCGEKLSGYQQPPYPNGQEAPPPHYYTAYTPTPSQRDKTTAIILCVIGFIGVAGLHRFYTGKILSGVLYLLTGGWCGIGTIVDLVMLGAGTFKDENGNPLM